MSIHLEDYADILEDLGTHATEMLEASWQEAVRAFSPAGLKHYYLEGARALHSVGRGKELVVAWIQETPAVARELGEDAVHELHNAAIRMCSRTSAAVITLLISTSPVAARRLGDQELFKGYIRLLDVLLAQTPRGVRPLLEHLDVLLENLTLGGLRRWATWGAEAHRQNLDAQVAYFGLETPESRSVFQKERRGTLFVDVQRRINIYLRALWARDFFMRPTSGDFERREGYRPFIHGYTIYMPDAYDDLDGISGLHIYRAVAAHAAAHVVHTHAAMPDDRPDGVLGALVELFEDARVETLAARDFPGLRKIWSPLHTATPDDGDDAVGLLSRAARALLDEDYDDPHPFIIRAREAFTAGAGDLNSNRLSWKLGKDLAPEFPDPDGFIARRHFPDVIYRDDNRYIWDVGIESDIDTVDVGVSRPQRRHVSVMEMVNELDVPGAGDDAEEILVLSTEFFRDSEDTSINEQEGRPPISLPFHYPEWDYQTRLERPHWCTVLERRPGFGDLALIDDLEKKHKPLVSRLKYLIEAMQPQGVQRIRKQEDGDELDVNALVDAAIDIRMDRQPDPRVYIRNQRKVRDLSVLVLVDLSESTNDEVHGGETTVVQLAREATALLSDALDRIGDPFAIHGFNSDGRHDVQYFRFKDFDAPHDDGSRARLAGMNGQLSTRMGAALRHAGASLRQRPTSKKLLLIVTDGEPSDTDVRDPQYLRHDAKRAVDELTRDGVYTFCMSLDPNADDYVERIFGVGRYMVVDRVERLPEKLPMLYAGLTR